MSGSREPTAAYEKTEVSVIVHDHPALPRFHTYKLQRRQQQQQARPPRIWRRVTRRPVAAVLLVLAVVVLGVISAYRPNGLGLSTPGWCIIGRHAHLPALLQKPNPASATMSDNNSGREDKGGGKQRTETGPAGEYPEHRRTRDAILHPRLIANLPAHYLPGFRAADADSDAERSSRPQSARPRVIVVGDVHGELEVLQNLLRKVGYTPAAKGGRDHVVLAGDIVNKGPDSPGVLALAMREGFSGVRGNHDDQLLQLFEQHVGKYDEDGEAFEEVGVGAAQASESDEDTNTEEDGSGDDDITLIAAMEEISLAKQQRLGSDLNGHRDDDNKHDDDEQETNRGKKHKKNKKDKKSKNKHDDKDKDKTKSEKKKHNKKSKDKKKHEHISHKDRAGLATIQSCTPAQRRWLANLPLILRVGHLPYISAASPVAEQEQEQEQEGQEGGHTHALSSRSSLTSSSTSPSPPRNAGSKKPAPPMPYGGELVVVHGGLVPGIPLEEQDPWAVMHIRTLLLKKGKHSKHKKYKKDKKNKKQRHKSSIERAASPPTGDRGEADDEEDNDDDDDDVSDELVDVHPDEDLDGLFSSFSSSSPAAAAKSIQGTAQERETDRVKIAMTPLESREGKPWARVWDKYQLKSVPDQSSRTTVVFGHDAKAGLQVGEYSFGLDTGCVAGGKLTAMVFYEDDRDEDRGGARDSRDGPLVSVAHRFVSVPCRAGVKYDL
ncbi:serine/threonine protein phosphatase 1 [Microdochium nivale]|nr:serine/threonine protein phosphatase 1 [Microdochium nivale]